MWDWKAASKKKDVVPEKKQKVVTAAKKKLERHICLQCLELCLQGKREERIKRHKERWHSQDDNKLCTIVPSNAKEVNTLKDKYVKKNEQMPAKNVQFVSSDHMQEQEESAANHLFSIEDQEMLEEASEDEHDELLEHPESAQAFQPIEIGSDCDVQSSLIKTGAKQANQTTLLQFGSTQASANSGELSHDTNLNQVMDAISTLTLKVDSISQQHKSFMQLALENGADRESLSAAQKAENIIQMMETSKLLEWFYDEATECGVLRCLPCFKLQIAAKPNLQHLTPFKAQQLLNKSGNGTLSTGILMKKEKSRQMITGHNQTWYRQKNLCLEHLCLIGNGSITHQSAMKEFNKERVIEEKRTTASSNIFRAAIVDLKLGAAGKHFKTLISFLACCSVDVGKIGHGRNNFSDILYCLEKVIDNKVNAWLCAPLPSNLLPPHFWATVDKATPSRTTNQAVIIVARDHRGIPCPIPVDSPKVYTDFAGASYDILAEQLLQALGSHFSDDVISRLCGVAADGPYQASGFSQQLRERLKIEEDVDLALPVTWDTAHVLNLAVTDVRDAKNASGEYFRLFVKRCNIFNHILSHGKGFAFLEMVDENARRPVSYAAQRFASSSYEQWVKIESSYESFWKAFELLHPNRNKEEEWQYMIAGSDFVEDLLAFLDIMEPVVELMKRAQSLDTPIWKLKLWWPKVKERLAKAANGDPEAYARLQKVKGALKPGGLFKGVKLLEGWMVLKDEGKSSGDDRFTWQMRENEDVCKDRERFANDLQESLEKRIMSVVNDDVVTHLEIFDASSLVNLQCGSAINDHVQFTLEEGVIEEYGVQECKQLLKVVSKMPHIQSVGMKFDPRLAHKYMRRIKKAMMEAVWNGLCPEWFVVLDEKEPRHDRDATLVEILPEESEGLDAIFRMAFSDGSVEKVRLNEPRVYESFYANKEFYDIVKAPSCALLDIALAKGGPEAIAESFYNSMRSQQQPGGQSNEALARRTKVNWCLPSLKNCESIIKEGVALYHTGDKQMPSHRKNTFFSTRAKSYNVSKVVDRVDSEQGRCPFLINGKE